MNKMDKSHAQGLETRRRNAQARRERHERERAERAAQISALRLVRDDPSSTPAERMRAVELLVELERKGYSYI